MSLSRFLNSPVAKIILRPSGDQFGSVSRPPSSGRSCQATAGGNDPRLLATSRTAP